MHKYWQISPDPGGELWFLWSTERKSLTIRRYVPTDQIATECVDGGDLERCYGYLPALYSPAGKY